MDSFALKETCTANSIPKKISFGGVKRGGQLFFLRVGAMRIGLHIERKFLTLVEIMHTPSKARKNAPRNDPWGKSMEESEGVKHLHAKKLTESKRFLCEVRHISGHDHYLPTIGSAQCQYAEAIIKADRAILVVKAIQTCNVSDI